MLNFTLTKMRVIALCMTLIAPCFVKAQTYTLDWGSSFSPAWPAGNSSNRTTTTIGASGLTATISFSGPEGTTPMSSFANYPSPQVGAGGTPVTTQLGSNVPNLAVGVDFMSNASYIDITIAFSGPVTDVNFNMADIDKSSNVSLTYLDQMTATAVNGAASVPNPTLTKINGTPVNNTTDTVLISGNSANANPTNMQGGNTPSNTTDQNGTVRIDFGIYAITTITIRYSNFSGTQANPAQQQMAISNIRFNKAVPPVTTAVNNVSLYNSYPGTAISGLAGTDDESVASYTVSTLPAGGSGVLQYFNGTSYVPVSAGQSLTPAQAASLRFDPTAGFAGTATFNYTATDNRGSVSNTSTFSIPIEPVSPPTANNIVAPVENSSYGQTPIPALSGSDPYGAVSSYTIKTIPLGTQGVLYLCNPTCATVTAGQSIAPADIANLRFDPAAAFTGNASFTYSVTNSLAVESNIATYTIPVKNEPPVANTILAQVLNNSFGSTPIPSLQASDIDGTIASYTITTIPNAGTQGVLYLCNPGCGAVTAGQTIAVADIAKLQFDPVAGFVGTARFNYTATDNNSNVSPAAAYNIPVKSQGVPLNIAPFADNIVGQQMNNSDAATLIPALAGHDVDGTITTYTIESIPSAAQGVLSYCSNSTEPCTGTVTPVAGVTNLTPAQMATLKFDPVATFTGTASFTYSATDNSTNKSNTANYSIPVVNVPPVANPVTTTPMSNTYAQTAIPPLSGHDPNTITTYTIATLPTGGSGTLYLCNPTCLPILVAGGTVPVADIGKLTFDPAGGFTGTSTFTYTVTDNNGVTSQPGTYNIPIIAGTPPSGTAPLANNVTSSGMPNTNGQTVISSLSASDADGTVSSYVINTLPSAADGVLYLCNPTCTAITAGQTIAAADAANLRFDPAAGANGNVVFDYIAKDNTGKISNIASYTIPVTATPPRAVNVQATSMAITDGPTPISSLSATDPDGSITSYTITSLPPANTGILYLCTPSCTVVTAGQVITAANAANLQFDPAGTYTGFYSQFNYTATDNTGRVSNTATVTLPLLVGNPLPVTLLNFTVEKQSSFALVKWDAEREINFKEYRIERSMDGVVFTEIGSVPVKQDAHNYYSFTDNLSLLNTGKVFYRLKQVDKDEKYSYSKVLAINLGKPNGKAIQVIPNPVRGALTIKVSSNSYFTTVIKVISHEGKVMLQQKASIVNGENIILVAGGEKLLDGGYIVTLNTGNELLRSKFAVQH